MTSAKPLTGIRVLELGSYISAPYAGSILAALGAEVVKIEPPGGDPFRRGQGAESLYYRQYNAGKKSIAVNLKSPDGVALIKGLLPKFDVLLENSRPGKTAALGLGAEVCLQINPRLIYSEVSGFGDSGTWRDRAAYDTIGQSMSGIYSIMNDQGKAALTGTCIGDLTTAIVSCMGVLAGLVGRGLHPEGSGMTTQTSLLEAISTITIDAMTQYYDTGTTPTRRSRHPQAQNFCVMTASGQALSVHLSSSQKFWENFARCLGREDLLQDPRFSSFTTRETHYFTLLALVEETVAAKDLAWWEERLVAFDVPFAPVLTMETLSQHPQYQHLGMQERDAEGRVLVQLPWRMNGTRPKRDDTVAQIGEHTLDYAAGVLPPEKLRELLEGGVLRHYSPAAVTP